VRSGGAEQFDEAKLRRATVATQLVLLTLCVARVSADLRRGPLTIEGDMALALLVVLATLLVAKAIAWAIRSISSAEKHPPSPPSPRTIVGVNDARSR
jgi:hypothetical protein